MKKRIAVVIFAGCVVAAGVSGCGSSSASKPSDLKPLTLALSDLPSGFKVTTEKYEKKPKDKKLLQHGWVASYDRYFTKSATPGSTSPPTGLLYVAASTVSFDTSSNAQYGIGEVEKIANKQFSKGHLTFKKLSSPGLGDQSDAFALSSTGAQAIAGEVFILRKGRYDAAVIGFGLAGLNSTTTVLPLAKRQVALLAKGK